MFGGFIGSHNEPYPVEGYMWLHFVNVANGFPPQPLVLWSNHTVSFGDSAQHGHWQYGEDSELGDNLDLLEVWFHHSGVNPKLHTLLRIYNSNSWVHWGSDWNDVAVMVPAARWDR